MKNKSFTYIFRLLCYNISKSFQCNKFLLFMNDINISVVQTSDFNLLFEIEKAAHLVPWSLGTLQNNQGERYCNLKIMFENQIVGFVICQKVLDEATIFNLAVDPEFQGKKFGLKLLETLLDQLKQEGILTVWLEVRESNKKATALYERCGFNQVDIRKNYYPTVDGKRENAIVMANYLLKE